MGAGLTAPWRQDGRSLVRPRRRGRNRRLHGRRSPLPSTSGSNASLTSSPPGQCYISLILLFKPARVVPRPAVLLLAFSVVFLLAANLYTTCTGTLTEAFITTVPQLPPAIIKGAVAAKGESLAWFDTPQVLGHVIVGWFTMLFCAIASVVLFRAMPAPSLTLLPSYSAALEFAASKRQTHAAQDMHRSPDSNHTTLSDEKAGSIDHSERV